MKNKRKATEYYSMINYLKKDSKNTLICNVDLTKDDKNNFD